MMYLDEWLKDKKAQGFLSKPHYFEDGDYISLFLTNDRCYAVSINSLVTIFYSITNNDIVGYKIERISSMKLKDVVKILIKHGVLLCDYEIKLPDVTGDTSFLGKRAIRHNEILRDLAMLSLSGVRDELKRGRRQNETRKEFLLRAFSKE